MCQLHEFTSSDAIRLGNDLRNAGLGAATMDEACDGMMSAIVNGFETPNNEKEVSLARLHMVAPFSMLSSERQKNAIKFRPDVFFAEDTQCFAVVGSAGEEEIWKSWSSLTEETATALKNENDIHRLPLLNGFFNANGATARDFIFSPEDVYRRSTDYALNAYHLENVRACPEFQNRREFLVENQIHSAMCLGEGLADRCLYCVTIWTKSPVSSRVARLFRTTPLAMKAPLIIHFRGGSI